MKRRQSGSSLTGAALGALRTRACAILALCLLADAPCPQVAAPPPLHLPHLRAALASNQPAIIVALGSSSTRGWMASDIAHSYPARLQRALSDALPRAHVAIINRGIGGQDAPEELARMDTDVIAIRPAAVIWQVGANAATHDVPPTIFRQLVEEGVAKLKAAGADVVLMDNQRSPRILASPDSAAIDTALADVARDTHVDLFSRTALMDRWRDAGAEYDAFIATDGLHMNDRGYACLAETLGVAVLDAVRRKPASAGDQATK